MKKYIKPAIEVFNIGATMPLMSSDVFSGGNQGEGQDGENLAPSKKGSAEDDFESEGW